MRYLTSFLLLLTSCAIAQPEVEEIIVTGEFRAAPLDALPASISVLAAEVLEERGARHLDEALALAANVNVAGGSARARFFQIRGIGERGQFVEPLNPSVGLLIDGVDLSTAASAATLFDVEQVEVFRGPQGTRFGANALAGLINLTTRAPAEHFEARLGVDAGNYEAVTLNGAISGPLGERVAVRLAAQSHRSEGFIDNTFLGTNTTNERDEFGLRGKLRWQAGDDLVVDGLLSYVDLDNGYDAFSLDNDRQTRSDEPGRDVQDTVLAGVDVRWDGAERFALEASASSARSDSVYSYDEDWTYAGFHPFGYASTDQYFRDRATLTSELRLLSEDAGRIMRGTTDWVVGFYALDSEVDLLRIYTFADGPFNSRFGIRRLALFGQLESKLTPSTTLTSGLRLERHQSDYEDSFGVRFSPSDALLGWRISLDHLLSDAHMLYATISRGYKAGGFNTDGTLDVDLRQYEPETLTNFELGLKASLADDRLQTRLTLFHMRRDDVQIASSTTRLRADGSTEFIDFIGNAAQGSNSGLEAELVFVPTRRLELSASVGVLDSKYEAFVNAAGQDLDGREQAHAPGYQFAFAVRYAFAEAWHVRLGIEGRDAFFFSDSHAERSRAYEMLNASLGYARGPWSARLWARNLSDEDSLIRGFFFGNDPRLDYAPRGYTQLGEPRRVGLSLTRAFQ